MESDPAFQTGRVIGLALFTLPALWFLVKAIRADARSARWANGSLFLGLLLFAQVEMLVEDVGRTGAVVSAGARALCGAGAIALAIAAFAARRRDGAVGFVRPTIALLFGALHLLISPSMLLFASMFPDDTGDPWTYRSATHAFEVTLPSSDWKEVPTTDAAVKFQRGGLSLHATVFVTPGDRERFDATVARSLAGATDRRDGADAIGRPAAYGSRVSPGADGTGEYFVAMRFIYDESRGVILWLILEGKLRMTSQSGGQRERAYYERCADSICDSLR